MSDQRPDGYFEKRLQADQIIHKTSIRKAVFEKENGKCHYCGCNLDYDKDFVVDHATPIFRNGTSDLCNLVPSCQECNFSKRHRTVEEFRSMISRRKKFANMLINKLNSKFPENRFYFETTGEEKK